jgi:predicted nucleic acid-binding protein
MIVVDASVVAYLFIEGELTDVVRELYRVDAEWVTPPILNHEILSILAAVGTEEQSSHSVEVIWRDVRALLAARQHVPDPVNSLRLAVEFGISGFDAQYLSLAQQLNLPLITGDARLIEAMRGRMGTPIAPVLTPGDYLRARAGS